MNAVPLCSGKDADAIVPGNVIVREEFLRANPDMAARYLAVFLRGIAFMKANREQTIQAMGRFYQAGGVTVSEAALNAEIDRRPIFGLEEQIQLMARSGGPSQADRWYEGLSAFLAQVGTVQNPPAPSAYLTDEVLRRIAADPRLRAFALGQ
jgi:NitT/TauT family transport system substrate-binding protein